MVRVEHSFCGICLLISLLISAQLSPVLARVHKKVHHKKIAHKKISPEEIAAAKQAQAREREESQFNQSRNSNMGRAYQLFDSGTNEALLGNYKYSLLQLKLASQLLNEHDEENSALGVATLAALASSAKRAGDGQLAITAYEKLLLMNRQDASILLKLARLQAGRGDFQTAQTNVNRVININPDNREALLLSDLINARSKANSIK